MKHENAYFDYYLSTIPGIDAKDIIEIKRAIRNNTPIVLNGAQRSWRTTLAKVLNYFGIKVYDDHVNCIVINMKKPIAGANMIPNAYDDIVAMIEKYEEE